MLQKVNGVKIMVMVRKCPDYEAIEQAAREGENPVLVTSAAIRPFVRSLVERFRAQTTVLSQAEIHPRAKLKTVGSV